ncbi:kelch-like protein 28 isoform X2 [Sipha flava]|uniref:Kelch-like protein 28 n=1 Tax=Sipha flava TaxID=143950 RepID=A0A2S2Q0Q4_9HEMI|nr:kelch-like protein 28 isoform X2 [Sipha flava]
MEKTDEPCVTILFDNGEKAEFSKMYLIKHSAYFEAMFCGNFMESHSGNQITLKDINNKGFMSVIESLKHNRIVYDGLENLLNILETSQLLQFTDIIQKSIEVITEKYLFSVHAVPIFSLASTLGLQELYEKARVFILYNFKKLLVLNKNSFFELNEEDLQQLLKDNGLNIDNEIDIFDLIIEWCSKTNNYNIGYEIAVDCVDFNAMDMVQLNYSITKTNHFNLINTIRHYINYKRGHETSLNLLIKPPRCVPHVLCAIKNEEDGYAFIYRWDWVSLKFTKFLRLDPLPLYTTGYHVIVHEMDIFVLAGEIGYLRDTWNRSGWKYNLLSKQWKKLDGFVSSKRRHGVGHFCGNALYLIGGHSNHRCPNELIEKFLLHKSLEMDTLVRVESYRCNNFTKNVDRKYYICLNYKKQLVVITKDHNPVWYGMCPDKCNSENVKWESCSMNLKATIISAVVYLDYVYLLAYSARYMIALYCYHPTEQLCREIKRFTTIYNPYTTMCAFNINMAMVFGKNYLECHSMAHDTNTRYKTQFDSFHSNYFFSIPYY